MMSSVATINDSNITRDMFASDVIAYMLDNDILKIDFQKDSPQALIATRNGNLMYFNSMTIPLDSSLLIRKNHNAINMIVEGFVIYKNSKLVSDVQFGDSHITILVGGEMQDWRNNENSPTIAKIMQPVDATLAYLTFNSDKLKETILKYCSE